MHTNPERCAIITMINNFEIGVYSMPTGVPTKMKRCSICQKEFLPKCPSQRICSETHYNVCPICNKPIVWNTTRAPEPCSNECKKVKLKQFYLQKYGVEHPMQSNTVQDKFKETMINRYGVSHALQNEEIKKKAITTNQAQFGCDWGLQSQEVRQKIKNTMQSKYGVDYGFQMSDFREKAEKSVKLKYGTQWATQAPEVKDKIKQTMLARYGVDSPIKIPEVKSRVQQHRAEHMAEIVENIRQTFISNYGVANCFQAEEIKDKIIQTCIDKYGVAHIMQNAEIKNKVCKTMESRYGVPWYVMAEQYRNNNNIISKINRNFGDALKTAGIPYKFEHRIDAFSYDIKIEDSPILVEINPTYTHNIIGCHWNTGISKTYHRDKMKIANDAGFHCINIFDWDNWEKIIPMLSTNKQKIDSNELDIYILTPGAANTFLKNYSTQGIYTKPAWNIGLVKNNIIYQMVTLSTPRYNSEYMAEIVRWQSNPQYEILGGYYKLLNFITSDEFYAINNIVLYFDDAKQFDMDILNYMKFVKDNPPIMIWSKGTKYITNRMFHQFGYKGIQSESELLANGWLPVYNCGYKVYEITI